MGETGCGKSTLVDMLMGLLSPASGTIYVDNSPLNQSLSVDFLSSWRNSIAHVPQDIYLADSTIAENIAFGVKPEEIDFERVKRSASLLRYPTLRA